MNRLEQRKMITLSEEFVNRNPDNSTDLNLAISMTLIYTDQSLRANLVEGSREFPRIDVNPDEDDEESRVKDAVRILNITDSQSSNSKSLLVEFSHGSFDRRLTFLHSS